MYILLGADFVSTESNSELFIKGDVEALLGEELIKLLNEASYRIFNLEAPLTDETHPIVKNGEVLAASTDCINAYKACRVDIFTLANNHILDYGLQGLISTFDTLRCAGINWVGAGKNVVEARDPLIIQFCNKKIGIYACAEHEFSVADYKTAGANPFDAFETFDHISLLKEKCDYVIVLYHGGKEHYMYPSPLLQKICHKLIDKGADLVLCQHSHCIGSEEKYKQGTILYGQGNFLFDHPGACECWGTGFLVQLFDDLTVKYVPVIKKENKVRLANQEQSENIIRGFKQRSIEVSDKQHIDDLFGDFADKMLAGYLSAFLGVNRKLWFRVMNRITHNKYGPRFFKKRYNRQDYARVLDYIECEAHRELLIAGLKNKL